MSLDYGVIKVFMAYMYMTFTLYVKMDTALFGHSDLSQICDITSVLFLGYGYSNYYGADVGKYYHLIPVSLPPLLLYML